MTMPQGTDVGALNDFDVFGRCCFTGRCVSEAAEKSLTKNQGGAQDFRSPGWVRFCLAAEHLRFQLGDQPRLLREANQITVTADVLPGFLRIIPATHTVGKIKRQVPAGKIKLKVPRRLLGRHSSMVTDKTHEAG
jgi:hypothetical protein